MYEVTLKAHSNGYKVLMNQRNIAYHANDNVCVVLHNNLEARCISFSSAFSLDFSHIITLFLGLYDLLNIPLHLLLYTAGGRTTTAIV